MNEIITIVAVTYKHGRLLRAFCDNMLNQHGVEGRWKCLILHDGSVHDSDPETYKSAVETDGIMMEFNCQGLGIQYMSVHPRGNCWGHNLRAHALEIVETPYLHFTNADNQYSIGWLERLIPVLERDAPDMVLWNISHSYTEFHNFRPELRGGQIDFCSYALRTELAKEVGFPWRHFEADSAQIETIRDRYPDLKVSRMENVFAFHN